MHGMLTSRTPRALTALVAVALLALGACGDDDEGDGAASDTTPSTTEPAALEQPAVWPAADVVFERPDAAAGDFVSKVLEVPPVLGPFQQGDARSGEIEVRSPGGGVAGTSVPRGVLLLRQLGPHDGWFVVGAVSDNASITAPESGAEVPAAPLEVTGQARGFGTHASVRAFVAGDSTGDLAQEFASGTAPALEPYTVTLDLGDAQPGNVVALLVRSGNWMTNDPGDFAAIPVVIAG